MKRSLLFAGIITCQLMAAQPPLKIYGYSQVFTPGMVPSEDAVDEGSGRKIEMPRFIVNYFIFIAADSGKKILPSEIWIGGKWDTVSGQTRVNTPFISEYPEKRTLVPATKLKVQQLVIGDTLRRQVKRSVTIQKMMKENQLIIVYWWNGKKYYARLKKIVELPPVHGV
jgi:hypothetical protein